MSHAGSVNGRLDRAQPMGDPTAGLVPEDLARYKFTLIKVMATQALRV